MESQALDWLIQYGYIIMFLVMLVEGPVATATAALGAALGYFNVFIVFGISFSANFLEDFAYYAVGRWGGHRVLDKYGARLGIRPEHRERAARFINSNMGKWLLLVKAVPLIGGPGLGAMGALGVPIRRFIWWDALVVGISSLFFVLVGYYSGKGYEFLAHATRFGGFGLAGAFLLFILISLGFRRLGRKISAGISNIAAPEESPSKTD